MMRVLNVLVIAASLAAVSCGGPGSNSSAPRANTGYVDFYTAAVEELSWEVKRANAKGEMKKVFSEFNAVPGTILRLAAPPGNHKFQVWFRNCVTEGPRPVDVQIENGKVTPVHVTLAPRGGTTVESRTYEYRPTRAATRRVTRVATGESIVYGIGAVAEAPRDFKPKEQMPYWLPPVK